MKLLEARVIAYNMMAPFIVPDSFDEYDIKVEDIWGDRTAKSVNLFKLWSNISLQHSIMFQRYSYNHFVGD